MPSRTLLSIPTWNQLQDPLADGEQDPFSAADCGEECAAMRIWYRTGIAMPAGILRQLIPDHRHRGETTPHDLVVLMRQFGLSPVALPTAGDAVQRLIESAIRKQVPPILLGYWEDRLHLHYILGVDVNAIGPLVNDPYGGRRVQLSWSGVDAAYAGWCIV